MQSNMRMRFARKALMVAEEARAALEFEQDWSAPRPGFRVQGAGCRVQGSGFIGGAGGGSSKTGLPSVLTFSKRESFY